MYNPRLGAARRFTDEPLAAWMAYAADVAYKRSVFHPTHRDDLRAVAYESLTKAMRRFCPDRGVKPLSYLTSVINRGIDEYLRKWAWEPRSVLEKRSAIRRAQQRLRSRFNREPTEDEVRRDLELTVKKWEYWKSEVIQYSQISFAERADESGEEMFIASPSDTPEEEALRDADVETIQQAIFLLSERERYVIIRRHWGEATYRVISRELEVTESRVFQIYEEAKVHLRELLRALRAPTMADGDEECLPCLI
jgi:RNA polymerase sigma factor (sigma-70 family)